MNWKSYKIEQPKERVLVLVFRHKNKKYTPARLTKTQLEQLEPGEDPWYWVTEHGCMHKVNENDLWFEFPYVKRRSEEVTYD